MRTLAQMTALSDKDRDLLCKVNDIIRSFFPDADVLLYGSIARGTADPESDYDLLVLTEEPLSKEEERTIDDAVFEVETTAGVIICAIFCPKEQWDTPLYRAMPFHWEVDRDAVVL